MNRFASLLLVSLPIAAFVACSSSSSGTSSGQATSDAGDTDAGDTDAGTGTGTQCTAARDQALLPINKVSTGTVSVVSESNGTKLLYVDASAGGINNAGKNPRVYVNLETATRVDLTDTAAFDSKEWDLALKRAVIYTNSGDMGIGVGGGAEIAKAFDAVTAADAASVAPEKLFDDQCTEQKDPTGAPATTFSNWYDYDQATNIPTPKPDLTYVVKGATGKLYKVGITSYMGLADGGTGQAGAMYLLKVAAL